METLLDGLAMVLAWPTILYLIGGMLLGLYLGAVPGLGGIIGFVILLPFTFEMEPVAAFAVLLAMVAVTSTSDTISSVLLGVPGTVASQATILDGFPLAQKGEAARAFGAAFTVSAIGGIVGAIVLGLSIPLARPIILSFAKPEFFMLSLLGLTMVGALSGSSLLKGFLAAMLGLLVAMVGYSVQGGVPRFYMGATYLLDGIPLVPMVLGIFAVPEIIQLAIRNRSIASAPVDAAGGRISDGIRDAFRNWWLVLRCTTIGVYIGMLPGLGSSIVDWVAYGHTVQSARDKSGFGKGDIRGVIGPESANNAVLGASLIPTIAFGIPGSAIMSILLGALIIHGLNPGVDMLTTRLDLTYSMIWTLVIANVLGAGLLLIWARQLARVTFLPGNLLVPAVVLFLFMGAWMASNTMADWYVLIGFGALGTVMKLAGWPRPPLVLGFVLGPVMENALDLSMQTYGLDWLLRPIVLGLAALVVLVVLASALGLLKRRKSGAENQSDLDQRQEPLISMILAGLTTALFAAAVWQAGAWTAAAALLPLTVCTPGIGLAALACIQDANAFRRLDAGKWLKDPDSKTDLRDGGLMMSFFAGLIALTFAVGQAVAIPLFMFAYLKFWAKQSLRFAAVYAAIGALFLFIMYDRLVGTVWHPSWLFG